MKLQDLLDERELGEMVEQGFVRVQCHPDFPLYIYNYSDKAMVNNVWNTVTKTCRGLIVNEKGDIIARPFPKFFNYGQKESLTYNENEPVQVTDKIDGSLGILYPTPDGSWAIATRGSFASDQAIHATKVLHAKYAHKFRHFTIDETWLFEIVYPENRIVVDYDGMDDLVLLGGVNIEEGTLLEVDLFLKDEWDGPRTEIFSFKSLAEALVAEPRAGKEGLVVHFLQSDTMVKIKQEDYLRLHKIVTGLNEHVVWEHLKSSGRIEELLESLPDEFHQWVKDVADKLFDGWFWMDQEVMETFIALEEAALVEGPRRDFALAIKDKPAWLKSCLFNELDGKNYAGIIWKFLEPKKDTFVR